MSERSDPSTGFGAVTPSDAASLPQLPRALYVGTGGDLTVRSANGVSVLFASVSAGSILPIRPDKVMATGTTASNIVALY